MTKPIVWIDMDGVLVDFSSHITSLQEKYPAFVEGVAPDEFDNVHGIFRYCQPMPGAIEAVKALSKEFDLYIATAAPWKNPESTGDKLCWLQHYFGGQFAKKVAITHCKHMLRGDYLIDDRLTNGAKDFRGMHIHFGSSRFPDWNAVTTFLLEIPMVKFDR